MPSGVVRAISVDDGVAGLLALGKHTRSSTTQRRPASPSSCRPGPNQESPARQRCFDRGGHPYGHRHHDAACCLPPKLDGVGQIGQSLNSLHVATSARLGNAGWRYGTGFATPRSTSADVLVRPSVERERIAQLERENRELRPPNEILKAVASSSWRSSTVSRRSSRIHRRQQRYVTIHAARFEHCLEAVQPEETK